MLTTNKKIIEKLLFLGVIKIKNEKLSVKRLSNLDESTLNFLLSKYKEIPIKIIIDIVTKHEGITPLCKFCHLSLDFNNLSNYKPISYSHKDCSHKDRISKIDYGDSIRKRKSTMKEIYGSEHLPVSKETIEKRKSTNKIRYGNEVVSRNEEIKNKIKKTKAERYQDQNYNNRDKSKNTCMEKYGVDNASKNIIIKSKIKKTNIEKNGGVGFGSDVIKESIKDTIKNLYAVDNIMKSKIHCDESVKNRKINYYGEDKLYLLENIETIHQDYLGNSKETLTSLADKIGVSRHSISEYFNKKNLEIFHRNTNGGKSKGEIRMLEIVRDFLPNTEIILNDRKIIAPKEIDIWIPEYKIGIEYHGSYWHTEQKVGDLHFIKAKMAFEKDITLLQFFDFETEEVIKDTINQCIHNNVSENLLIDSLKPIGIINKKKDHIVEHIKSTYIIDNVLNAGFFILKVKVL